MKPLRVLLASDHKLVADGLECLVDEGAVDAVGEAFSGDEVLERATETEPDVIVLDWVLQRMSGLDVLSRLAENSPSRVIIVSARDNANEIAYAIRLGTAGYLTYHETGEQLDDALHAVSEGQRWIPDRHRQAVEQMLETGDIRDIDPVFTQLSAREREVLKLLADGQTNKEVGETLHISAKTVDSHRQKIHQKLGITDVTDVVKHAIRSGLTTEQVAD